MNKSIRIPDWRFFHPYSGDFVKLLSKKMTYLCLVMGSGSKSRVQVPFPGFRSGTKKVGLSLGFGFFWLPDDITIDGFG